MEYIYISRLYRPPPAAAWISLSFLAYLSVSDDDDDVDGEP